MTFMLHARATHVFAEAERVYLYKAECENESIDPQDKARKLGQLMNESHFSCRDLYECSSPELDEIT